MQQVLPVHSGLYWYEEWMVQDINDKTVTQVNTTLRKLL